MVQLSLHAAAGARQARRGRGRAAGQQDGHGPGAGRARQGDGPGLHLLRGLRPRATTSSTLREVEVVERDYPLLDAKEVNAADQAPAAPPAGRRRRLHRHRRPHGRHRRDPQHQGLRGGEGPGVLPRAQGREPRRPGARCPSSSSGPARRRPTPSWSPRSSPSATPTCTTPARCRRRSARRYPAGQRPLLVVGGPRFDETHAAELGVDRIFGKGTTPGEVASYLVHAPRARQPDRRARSADDAARRPDPRSALTVTHRRYVPYSHAHYAGNLVDGAYVLALFGDVATELCIRTDGDEGLFASYSDVQFRRAGPGRRRARGDRDGGPRRDRAAASWPSRRGWSAGPPRACAVGGRGARRAAGLHHRHRRPWSSRPDAR